MNKQILVGNAGKDPESKTLESGAKVARVRVATNRNWLDKKSEEWQTETTWHTVVGWGFVADAIMRIKSGDLVTVEGRTTKRKYTDKDNIEREAVEVLCESIKRISKREETASQPAPAPPTELSNPADDLPF